MGYVSEKHTNADWEYFCNVCDDGHVDELVADDCFDACGGTLRDTARAIYEGGGYFVDVRLPSGYIQYDHGMTKEEIYADLLARFDPLGALANL